MRLLGFLGGNTDCLFESYNSSSAYDLFEDYGNLKSINSKLLKVFHVGTDKSDSDLSTVGRSSAIVEIPAPGRGNSKNFDHYWNYFYKDPKAIGVVVSINKKQVISFAQMDKMNKKGKFNVVGLLPDDFINSIDNESITKHINDINFQGTPVTKPATYLRDILDEIVKFCNSNDKTISCSIITFDEERAQKGVARRDAQSGVIPLPGQRGYISYIKSLTTDLRSKLKSVKIEELSTLIKRNGVLAEFEWRDVVYRKYVSQVDLEKLQNTNGPASGKEGVGTFIEYKANRNDVKEAAEHGNPVPTYVKVFLKTGRNGLSLEIDSVELK